MRCHWLLAMGSAGGTSRCKRLKADTSRVFYVPKKCKNVVLMSTLHRDGRICGQEHQKLEIIMDYNATKGGVDNLDKLVTGCSCKRRTLHRPLEMFNILDFSAYNAIVIWMVLNPDWNRGKLQKRQLFLEELGKALVRPQIQRRQHIPRNPVRRIQEEDAGSPSARPTEPTTPIPEIAAGSNKKKHCDVCEPKKDRKAQYTHIKYKKCICNTQTPSLMWCVDRP
ncbi:uncharacterized protein isoform X2 [Salmo salar]|uniref:Uncharacterized protein isoform X2 n=1 Tax=Salmo salar TaxID=8030 RepID=A0ABM3EJY9_SALSA|nr:uncharacterized protein LOC123741716 isoform X2 [Salmo salar]